MQADTPYNHRTLVLRLAMSLSALRAHSAFTLTVLLVGLAAGVVSRCCTPSSIWPLATAWDALFLSH